MGNTTSNPKHIFKNKFIYDINIPFKNDNFIFKKNIDFEKKNVIVTISIGKDKIEITNKNIKQIYIEFKNKERGDIMEKIQTIWNLDLSHNNIGYFNYNKERIFINSLNLSHNKIKDSILERNKDYIFNSKKINLSNNQIELGNIDDFFNDENIPYFKNIEELDLSNNKINTGNFINLLDKLIQYKDNINLKKLNICSNPLGLDDNIIEKKKQLLTIEILMSYDTNEMNKIIRKMNQLQKMVKHYLLKIDSFLLNYSLENDIKIIVKTKEKEYSKIIYKNKLVRGDMLNPNKSKYESSIYAYKFKDNIDFYLDSIEDLEIIINRILVNKDLYEIVELFRCSIEENDFKTQSSNEFKDSILGIIEKKIPTNIFNFKKEYDLNGVIKGIIEGSIEKIDDMTQEKKNSSKKQQRINNNVPKSVNQYVSNSKKNFYFNQKDPFNV